MRQKLNEKVWNMKNRILIVDDEPNILMSLEFQFKKKGYEVFIARNGREAMDIIENSIPDLVILDIMMPEVDGYEVCEHIKTSISTKDVKVIFLSAKISEADIQKGYSMGADMYITKPFSNKNLMEKVQELI